MPWKNSTESLLIYQTAEAGNSKISLTKPGRNSGLNFWTMKMNDGNKGDDHEEALFRRRFDEFTAKGIAILIPVVIALGGWALSLQTRLSEVDTKQEERWMRISAIEQQLKETSAVAREPRPETRVEIKAIVDRMDRLEERVNSLHSYILALPIRPAPIPYAPSKRGDIRLEDIIKGGDIRLN